MKNAVLISSIVAALALGGGAVWFASQIGDDQISSSQQSVASSQPSKATDKAIPKAVTWEDLLPVGEQASLPLDAASDFFDQKSAPFSSSETGGDPNPMMSVPLPKFEPRQDMADTFIKIAGYMTPFNVEAGKTRTFLLVPYVGACIHVPAPPANQIVLVEAPEPVEVLEMWTPFEAVGTLRIENISTNLAEVAYTMELDRIEPYVFENKDAEKTKSN